MQELIDKLNEMAESHMSDTPEEQEYKGGLRVAATHAEIMLGFEKSAIQQAFYEGMLCQGFDPNMGRAEMYYNEVYNTKEE